MIVEPLDTLAKSRATIGLLCKTAVARKALAHAWKNRIALAEAEIHKIDAAESFDAAADACLLLCTITSTGAARDRLVYQNLDDRRHIATIGYRDDPLVADANAYDRWKH
jgi:hypothetical protein